MNRLAGKLIVVSNRLPVSVERRGANVRIVPSSGGLVRALAQTLQRVPGVWIGWSGADEDPALEARIRQFQGGFSLGLCPVNLTSPETSSFYYGFSNEIIWPLFHDLQSRCNFDPAYWNTYRQVNRKFARAVLEQSSPEDFVWVHDYHLAHVAENIREERDDQNIGFFLHIPFPPPDIFEKLPWREEYLRALLQYNLLGFQTARDLHNFSACLQTIMPEAVHTRGEGLDIVFAGKRTRAASFPISIDFRAIARLAAGGPAESRRREICACLPRHTLLGVDRLDYTKGVPERLKAFQLLLKQHPGLRRHITLIQIVVPSREAVPKYQELKRDIERLVSGINGEFSEPGWAPVQYLYRNLGLEELLAYYRAADIALVTPLKDGMNLVAKEFCAARVENDGVLVLSEFAGAAAQLKKGALLVNPYDTVATAEAIRRACEMPQSDRQARMKELRTGIERQDVFRWLDDFQLAADCAGERAGGLSMPAVGAASAKALEMALEGIPS